jgi:hypothetical protein
MRPKKKRTTGTLSLVAPARPEFSKGILPATLHTITGIKIHGQDALQVSRFSLSPFFFSIFQSARVSFRGAGILPAIFCGTTEINAPISGVSPGLYSSSL